MRDWDCLTDAELVERYERARRLPADPEGRSLLRAIQVRASRNGRCENLLAHIRVVYLWVPAMEDVVRHVLTEMGARARRRAMEAQQKKLARATQIKKHKGHRALRQTA